MLQTDLDRFEGAGSATGRSATMGHRVQERETGPDTVVAGAELVLRGGAPTHLPHYAHWCDTTFDLSAGGAARPPRAISRVRGAPSSPGSPRKHPAIFVAAPRDPLAVHRRFDNVIFWPSRAWLSLWQWRVRRGEALARDH